MSQYKEEQGAVATKAWDHRLFQRLVTYARPHWLLFLACFGVLSSLFALELAGPWIWRKSIDGPVADAWNAPVGTDKSLYVDALLGWVALYALVIVGATILRYFQVSTLNRTGQTVIHDLRTKLFRHIQRLDLSFFDKQPTGSLVTRVTSDVENLAELFSSGIVALGFDSLRIVVLVIALFWIHAQLALVVLLLLPILIGISIVFRGGARKAHRTVRARLANLNGYLQEVLSGVRVVQVFRREERVSKQFEERLHAYFLANKRTIFLFALFFPAMSLAVYVIQGTALSVGVDAMTEDKLTYGQFFQFWLLLDMLVRPIRELGERYNVLQSAFASAERIFQVLDTESGVQESARPKALTASGATPPHIRFEDIRFSYATGKEVLHGVSFEIPPGQTVALVGATGSGKSTLINLLLRFYDPSQGRITLDGTDLRELSLTELRARFGLVLQENFLFSGTIEENLILDRAGISEADLQSALSSSSADRLVESLPGGLQAPVAERGVTFSTGERQLLAIARTLAGKPSVVILDEATASVDSETEAGIENATRHLLRGRSALVVAHRLSTIRRAHKILVLDQGEIVEAGTHDELLEMGGTYAKLHELQFELEG
ncbi:MAG: ABC transporter ATP-binding protein [Planctomycetota bacterium]|nr:ABC transporter ATP-binding protein [Planctomycetota bacterium]